MSVMENLELGAYLRNDKDGIARDLEDVFKKFPRLLERKDQISGTLPAVSSKCWLWDGL